jgi:hypothetical protein
VCKPLPPEPEIMPGLRPFIDSILHFTGKNLHFAGVISQQP